MRQFPQQMLQGTGWVCRHYSAAFGILLPMLIMLVMALAVLLVMPGGARALLRNKLFSAPFGLSFAVDRLLNSTTDEDVLTLWWWQSVALFRLILSLKLRDID